MGASNTVTSVQVPIPAVAALSGYLKLALKVHGLEYDSEASVQINGGAWFPINSASVRGNGSQYGMIGGGFSTLYFLIHPPIGAFVAGTNTISFRFNGTDGNSSGYRVLWLNVLAPGNISLIGGSSFVNDDPSSWTAPLNSSADIAAGESLWRSASLVQPDATGSTQPIAAHCGDCHTQDGRDLKYFNYSNQSIHTRAVFHGLSDTQADQIASYIRSLATPAPSAARPWNPPYQPGPGMDSKPVTEWAAGAGLGAVLNSDAAIEGYLVPGGSTANWGAQAYLNTRELPIDLQLPDWNHWLPRVHPKDAWGSTFTNDPLNTQYQKLRGDLAPNDAAAYAAALHSGDYVNWSIDQDNFLVPIESSNPNWDTNDMRNKVYSTALWQMVKLWEINQEFGLEGMPQIPFGAAAEVRAWYGNRPFHTSPNMLHIPPGAGLGNGSTMTQAYLAYIWYHLQLVLNDGNGMEHGQDPIDYPYVLGFVKALAQDAPNTSQAMLQLTWLVKALQEETQPGIGPEQGSGGWQPIYADPSSLVNSAWSSAWYGVDPVTRASMYEAYLQAWFPQVSSFTPQQFYQGGWANPNDNPALLDSNANFGGIVWYMLPRFRYYGVDPLLTAQISAWAATVWPNGNWVLNQLATCNAVLQCTSD